MRLRNPSMTIVCTCSCDVAEKDLRKCCGVGQPPVARNTCDRVANQMFACVFVGARRRVDPRGLLAAKSLPVRSCSDHPFVFTPHPGCTRTSNLLALLTWPELRYHVVCTRTPSARSTPIELAGRGCLGSSEYTSWLAAVVDACKSQISGNSYSLYPYTVSRAVSGRFPPEQIRP